MSKRQIRISSANISSKEDLWKGKVINLVLKDDSVIHGVIQRYENESLILIDERFKKHKVELDHIEELVVDFIQVLS